MVTSWRRMTSRFRHGLGTAGPPRPLQADTPVTWVTKVINAVGYRTSNGRFPKRENRSQRSHWTEGTKEIDAEPLKKASSDKTSFVFVEGTVSPVLYRQYDTR